jgi:NADH-quinone oxidoreductase subunit N
MNELATTLAPIAPEFIVALTAFAVIIADALLARPAARNWLPVLTVLGLLLALIAPAVFLIPTNATDLPLPLPPQTPLVPAVGTFFNGFVLVDGFTSFFRALFILLAVFGTVVAPAYLERKRIPIGEYYATLLFSTLGAMTIALSTDLITLFVGLDPGLRARRDPAPRPLRDRGGAEVLPPRRVQLGAPRVRLCLALRRRGLDEL